MTFYRLRQWARFLSALYSVLVIVFLIVRGLLGDPTPVALVNRYLPLALLPALLLLPICLTLRRWR